MSDKIFLFLDSVTGSSTDTNHLGWVPINSVDFEVVRAIEFKLFSEKLAPENSTPSLSKIIITKPSCTASPQLFSNLYSLQKSRIIIDIIHEKIDGIIESIAGSGSTRYESEVSYISKYKASGAGNSLEKIELTVSSLSMTYNPPMDSHELDKKSTSGYHFQRLKPL